MSKITLSVAARTMMSLIDAQWDNPASLESPTGDNPRATLSVDVPLSPGMLDTSLDDFAENVLRRPAKDLAESLRMARGGLSRFVELPPPKDKPFSRHRYGGMSLLATITDVPVHAMKFEVGFI